MIEWITTGMAVCWLLFQLVRLLWRPVEVDTIGLHLPPVPVVVIDVIRPQCVVLRWELVPGSDHYYVVCLDGQEVAKVAGKILCRLTNLPQSKVVCIEVVAVNTITKFRSKLVPVYVEPGYVDSNLDTPPTVVAPKEPVLMAEVPQLIINDIRLISDPNLLNVQLESYQSELVKTTGEYDLFKALAATELRQLTEKLGTIKAQFDEEHDEKMKKEHHVRLLEKRKNELVFTKLKLKDQLDQLTHAIHLHELKVDDVREKADKLRRNNAGLLSHEPQDHSKIDGQIQEITAENDSIRDKLAEIEATIKQLIAEKKSLAATASEIRAASESGDFGDIAKVADVEDLVAQLSHDDEKWKRVYRQEIKKYVAIHQLLEMARLSRHPGYHPHKMSEYTASVEFGDPLPKKKYGRVATPDIAEEKVPLGPGSFHNHYEWVYAHENNLGALSPDLVASNHSHVRLVSANSMAGSVSNSIVGATVPLAAPMTAANTLDGYLSPPLAQPVPELVDHLKLDPEFNLNYNNYQQGALYPPFMSDYNSLLYAYSTPNLPNTQLSPPPLVSLTPIPQLWNDSLNLAPTSSNSNIWALDDGRGHARNLSLSLWKHDIRLDFSPFGPEEREKRRIS